MRDLDALIASLVNVDRVSLIAILTSEAEIAQTMGIRVAREKSISYRGRTRWIMEQGACDAVNS
jgi:hypothetical protein